MFEGYSKNPNEYGSNYSENGPFANFGYHPKMQSVISLEQALSAQKQAMQHPSIPAYQNPFNQINPKYTQNQFQHQNQNQNSFAPMQMYQNYKQTGQMPAGDGTVMTGKPTVGGK